MESGCLKLDSIPPVRENLTAIHRNGDMTVQKHAQARTKLVDTKKMFQRGKLNIEKRNNISLEGFHQLKHLLG